MVQVPIGLRLDEGLLARVDEARGDVPRARWIAQACELLLAAQADQGRRTELFGPRSDNGVLPPARGETFEEALPVGHRARVPARPVARAAHAPNCKCPVCS